MTPRVAVVIDSTASIPQRFIEELPITIVPNMLNWEGESFRDGIDILPEAFYERLKTSSEHPTTSQVPPSVMGQAFDRLHDEGYAVLAILLSQKISGTYQSGLIAQAERPGRPIRVIDSESSGMGSGWAAVMAARAARRGADLAACEAVAREALANAGVVGTVNTLKYLHRAGRIGGAARFLGSALNLKPVLELKEGIIEGVDRVRTRRKAIARMLDLLEERIAGRVPVRLAVMHANDYAAAASLEEQVKDRFMPLETTISDFSPILGTNFGEGTLGVCFLAGME